MRESEEKVGVEGTARDQHTDSPAQPIRQRHDQDGTTRSTHRVGARVRCALDRERVCWGGLDIGAEGRNTRHGHHVHITHIMVRLGHALLQSTLAVGVPIPGTAHDGSDVHSQA